MWEFFEKLRNWFTGNGWRSSDGMDEIREQAGVQDDYNSANSTFGSGNDFGKTMNDLTGTTASQQWQAAEAEKQRDYETAERIAAEQYNSAEAQKARDWQLSMDSTQVQRRMEDLQSAGLNPMAMVSGGSMLTGVGSSGSTAASVSPASGAAAQGSGNSAAAVGSAIRAVGSLVAAIAKVAK